MEVEQVEGSGVQFGIGSRRMAKVKLKAVRRGVVKARPGPVKAKGRSKLILKVPKLKEEFVDPDIQMMIDTLASQISRGLRRPGSVSNRRGKVSARAG